MPDTGRLPDGTGLGAPEGAEPHSRLGATPAIPSADGGTRFWSVLQIGTVLCWFIVWCVEIYGEGGLYDWLMLAGNAAYLIAIIRRLWLFRSPA
jgi:hypothetical protein